MNTPTRLSRRDALRSAAIAGGSALIAGRAAYAQVGPAFTSDSAPPIPHDAASPPAEAGRDYNPVIVPNGWTLPYRLVDGVKVFHLVAEEVLHEFAPGLKARCWGYNGSVHGPLIEAVEGDRVRIFVTNRLAASTTVHWHGVLVPSGMDGVGGLSQRAIAPGETFVYAFTLRQHGTCMYHAHHDEMTQMGMGMTGLFVIHPRGVPAGQRPDRDFALLLHEWNVPVGTDRPNPNEMTDFNILTMNARVYPGTAPLVIGLGERVRIRIGNLSAMDHHPIHLHGATFRVVATDGGDVPRATQSEQTSVLVGVGQTRDIELVADNPGDWAMHCHMTHHVMNQMGHDGPNMIGVDAGPFDQQVRPLLPGYMTMGQTGMADMGEMGMRNPPNSIPMAGGRGPHDYITMGGMFTILKVRAGTPSDQSDPGWYANPPGEQADLASPELMRANGIDPDARTAARPTSGPTTGPTTAPASTATTAPTIAPAALYVCPMDPEVTSPVPGSCPKCGMTLRRRA